MQIYFSSPNNQLQAHIVNSRPVLISYAIAKGQSWLESYIPSFGNLLIDSGAYSAWNSKRTVDCAEYADWASQFIGRADAFAGLDDISGDWRLSMKNYQQFELGFPTIHDSDPPELLDELICMARERPSRWIGMGVLPPKRKKRDWVYETIEKIPDDLHIHGWALRWHLHKRLSSTDSTNWWRDGYYYKKKLPFLTYAECLDLVMKRYEREGYQKVSDLDMESGEE